MIKRSKRSAFLLSEAVVSLFIMILALSILLFLIQTYHQQQKVLFHANSSWLISVSELEELTVHSSLQNVTTDGVTFVTDNDYKKPHKIYRLQIYHDMLRMTGQIHGHMPVLINQKSINLMVVNNTVKISTIDQLNRKWEYYLDFK
ncbi:ComGF family competence protein [Bombilactobacillus thymidiniphilus]|uniref:ComGF family competence protein n=1 Tax=Bombilactobacillus thymidiniphilus TaxID=2923363 RepID=A0ABY4PDK7_9LACO|nr:ComGF family competence protein [Bombilactobacillus thymidiniphilus]UQS83801.1 ComGF family competence protein [Bombilactobacillus thymidiniphilus]